MHIVVCIKQVPDTSEVRIDPETNTLVREGVPSIINPHDENAIEAALQLKEEHGAAVTAITMGPPQAEDALRQALAMGCDEAILISDRAFAGSDTLATSYILAQAIRKIGDYDLIICGKQAFDGDTAQVGPGIAEHLGVPQATYAVAVALDGGRLRAQRLLSGRFETLEMKLPGLVTADKHMNDPRHAGLKSVMRARKKEIATWTLEDLGADPEWCGLSGSPTMVMAIFPPERSHKGERIEGEPHEAARQLLAKLREGQVV
jgi:electron transfer flavoprotein beta subunit